MSETARRPLLWWDIGFVATNLFTISLSLVFHLLVESPERDTLALSLAMHFALIFVYAALGRPALKRSTFDEPATRADTLFLVLLILLVTVATVFEPNNASLQFISYPLIWSLIASYNWAIVANVALASFVGAALGLSPFYEVAPIRALLIAALSFSFSVAMGTWITRIFERGERYRELSESLRASQQEVAALSLAAGVTAERERLSRELHDTLTQTLTGLVMLSEQAERALHSGDTDRAADRIARVSEASREAMAEARALIATTQPLSDGGLVASIERIAGRLRLDTGLEVTVSVSEAFRNIELDRDLEVVLLRATQEALSNARRHAQANAVDVHLEESSPDVVSLRVEDDGVGPSPDAVQGFGLSGLSARVREVGGSVSFGPRASGGTIVKVSVPRD